MKSTNTHQQTTLSRRHFCGRCLATAASIGAVSALGPSALSAADTPAKETMRIGLATYMWGDAWDIPALIANCQKAGLFGVELRTSSKYPHGVETTITTEKRAEVKKQFADSPVRVVSIACSERFDWPQPEKLQAALKAAKAHLQLSHDVGSEALRVFPNSFHPNIPHEKTIEQIARAMDELGQFAEDLGQEVSLEAHGPAGELPSMRTIMDHTTRRNVRVRLNCDARDTQGKGFTENFNLVQNYLSRVIHIHDLNDPKYPYGLMIGLLEKAKWQGWALVERSDKVPDRVAAMIEQRQLWEKMLDKSNEK